MKNKFVTVDLSDEPEDPFAFLLHVTRKHGDAIRYTGPLGDTYLFNHPESIRQVLQDSQFQRTSLVKIVLGEGLLASDGEYWSKQRRLLQPFFHRLAKDKLEQKICMHTHSMLQRWEVMSEENRSLDVADEMTQLTLTIIVDVLFGVDLGEEINALGDVLDVLLQDLGDMGCSQLNTPLTFTPSSRQRFQSALSKLDEIVFDIIEQRRKMPADPDNLLSYLLSARDEKTGKKLSDRQLRDEVVTMMIAGHETTALILTWGWSLLSSHPAIEQILHRELDQFLGSRIPGISDLEHLPHALMILQESMRLSPPVWFIARKSLCSGEVNGYPVPGNVLVIVSPYAIHRHPGFWENPDVFEINRFKPGVHHTKYSYIPFGGGRHLCLGMHLALIEGHLILASIAQQFSLQPVSGCEARPLAAITLRLRDGLQAVPCRRDKNRALSTRSGSR